MSRATDDVLAEALEDFHRRRALGESPTPADYRDRLGPAAGDFVAVIDAERAIDAALTPPPPEAALPRVFGGYTLLSEIGRGAAGVVYEALDRDLGRTVALKVLRVGFDTDAVARERFRREARACARIHHPNVVEVFAADEIDGRPCYAMSRVEGESLASLVRSGRAPAPEALARGLAGVAEGLDALHRAGVVHRDVKPSNILVKPDGQMVLADFGLARSTGAATLTDTGASLGTPMYMSPEQVLGEEVDARTDVYALGITLYEALAGKPPFRDGELQALLRSILASRAEAPRPDGRTVPPALAGVALKAIEKRREDRYASAADLARDLRSFADGGRVVGKPVGPFVLAARAVRRRWAPIAAAVALVVGAGFWWSSRPASLEVAVAIPAEGAEIYVDGALLGVAAARVDLSPGEHELVVRRAGFADAVRPLRLEPGERHVLEIALRADPGDHAAVACVCEALGMAPGSRVEVDPHRAAATAAAVPVHPTGAVRADSLERYRIDVTEGLQGGATVRFFAGDGATPIHESVVDPSSTGVFEAPLPAEVLAVARTGVPVRWGVFEMAGAEDVTTGFTAVDRPEVDAAIERLGDQPAFRDQDSSVRDLVRARLLETHGLDGEAFAVYADLSAREPSAFPAWEGVLRTARSLGRETLPLVDEAVRALSRRP